jgi:flavin reductase (DIM6/NTAB) family NADH-FMN oxidoreductase RutF
MRTDFAPEELGTGRFYALMTASIVPRPIAWVSTTSEEGVDNVAPHSFFTVACVAPAIVQFTSVGRKDTLRNVEATGEFVVNITPEGLFEEVNRTGTNYPGHVSEFDAVGLEREPSLTVRPPRVASAPVAFECALHGTIGLGNSWIVLGRVLHAVAATDVLAEDGLPDIHKLEPVSRLGRNEWGTRGEIRTIDRIPYEAD